MIRTLVSVVIVAIAVAACATSRSQERLAEEARARLDCPTGELTIERRRESSRNGSASVDFYESFTGCGRTVVFVSTCQVAVTLDDDACPSSMRTVVEDR